MANSADTFERSCDHWSEAGRSEMEDFYALASVDYRHLAEAIDWETWFKTRQKIVGQRSLRLLDVACGSGKFPAALKSHAGITSAAIRPVDYALLDPSSFSIAEARHALAAPFQAGAEYEMTLQDFKCPPGSFDIVWATHALYAIPYNELEIALRRMLDAMGCDGEAENVGAGFIAHASAQSHYLKFFQYYLSGFKDGIGAPYSSAEQIIKMLTQMGLSVEVREINYTNGALQDKERQVERYLQRCLFDDTVSLEEMLSNPITGPYLETCRKNGQWQFSQRVSMIFVNASADSVFR
ncbi:class I SAM-dependent methyltransferase [Gammaproteobacteria bacterium]|nr:class I SAM-dependent methyltransferase [Gammaproteobacteria bacterium]